MNNLPDNVTEVWNDGQSAYYKVRMDFSNTFKTLPDKITEYLTAGGLFNPEEMDHDKVRDLLIECRDKLTQPLIDLTPKEITDIEDEIDWSDIDWSDKSTIEFYNRLIKAYRIKNGL